MADGNITVTVQDLRSDEARERDLWAARGRWLTEKLCELLYRMLEAPTTQISPSWKEEIRPALVAPGCKTPDGCRENGCRGWCDEHTSEGPKP